MISPGLLPETSTYGKPEIFIEETSNHAVSPKALTEFLSDIE